MAQVPSPPSCCFRARRLPGPCRRRRAEVSRNYQVGNFQQIEVAGPYDVEFGRRQPERFGPRPARSCSSKTVVEVQGDKLVIHPEEQHGFPHWGWGSHGKAHFTVTVPQLTRRHDRRIGRHQVDQVQGDSFEGTVAGSGGLDVGCARRPVAEALDRRLGQREGGQRQSAERRL